MGVLTVKIDGKLVEFDHCMTSGGYCSIDFDGEGEDEIHSGPWSVHLPPEYEQYEQEITDLVNENVSHGCCGGCI